MKKKSLRQGLLSACLLPLLLSAGVSKAQDNYWLLDGNKCLNTATRTVISGAAAVGPASNPYVRTIYDPTGHELFSYGYNDLTYNTSFLTTGGVQVFPIPGLCKQYYLLDVYNNPGPHVATVTLTRINASGSGAPVVGSPVSLTNLGPMHYGVIAGKADPVTGERPIYCLSPTFTSTTTCDLFCFKVAYNGSFGPSSSYTTVITGIPKCLEKARIKMAPDGQSLAYTDITGKLVTISDLTTSPTATIYSENALGMAEVTVPTGSGPERRWYVSTGAKLGYFKEKFAAFTQITASGSSIGINTDIAQGKDGNLYIANGNPAISTGALAYFSPSAATPTFSTISGAQIVGVNNASSPTAYTFGNQVEGADINNTYSAAATSLSFSLNGIANTVPAPGIIWACPGSNTVPLHVDVTGYHTNVHFSYAYSTTLAGPYTGGSTVGPIMTPTDYTYNGVFWVGNPATSFFLRFTVYMTDICGNYVTASQTYEVRPTGLLVDFKLTGPSFTPCNTAGLTKVTNISALANSSPYSQPATSGFCKDGWLGAYTAGVQSGTYTPTGTITANSYTATVEEVNSAGIVLGSPLGTYTQAAPLYGFPLGAVVGSYFLSNYNTIKNNNYFKVTLSVATTECGNISNYSYFRIIDGGSSGGFLKEAGLPDGDIQLEEAHVFPNPATEKIHLNWRNKTAAHNAKAQLMLMDVMGKVVLQQELDQQEGNNDIVLDVSSLTPGIYHYVLKTASGDFNGKLAKQ